MSTDEYITKPEISTKIWRYINYDKFVSLINTSTLFFTQAKRFNDAFEGSMELLDLGRVEGTELQAQLKEDYNSPNAWRAYTGISCWHMNDHESLAMWDLYIPDKQGVAIQSTVERLNKSLIKVESFDTLLSGAVTYTTKFSKPMPGHDYTSSELVFFVKQPMYSHEKEYRMIVLAHDINFIHREGGLRIPIDLAVLIKAIYIAPHEPLWKKNFIQEIIQNKLRLSIPVFMSDLNTHPTY